MDHMRIFLVSYLVNMADHRGRVIQVERRVRLASLLAVSQLIAELGPDEWKEVKEESGLHSRSYLNPHRMDYPGELKSIAEQIHYHVTNQKPKEN